MLRPDHVSAEQRLAIRRPAGEMASLLRERDRIRPRRRSDCWPMRLALYADGPDDEFSRHKPCPFVSCRFNLQADVMANGTIVLMPTDIAHTCVLDIVDAHPDGVDRAEIATICRVSEERTRIFERRIEERVREDGRLAVWAGNSEQIEEH